MNKQYYKEWRKKNRDKLREYEKRYYQKHMEQIRKRKREYYKKWYQKHKDYEKQRKKKTFLKIKNEVLSHYSNGTPKCVCCGETHIEFLTINHIKGGGRKHREELGIRGGHKFYWWLKKNNYPEGFNVMCMNCNFAFGVYGYCPHKLSEGGLKCHSK